MKQISTATWLMLILAWSFVITAVNLAAGDSPGRVIFRALGLLLLFYLLLKGKNFARILLTLLYGVAGLMLAFRVVTTWEQFSLASIAFLVLVAGLSLGSAAFLWRSPVLRELTGAKG